MEEEQTESSIADFSVSPVSRSLLTKARRTRLAPAVLPTRVTSACERCRLHKSRCDPYWPCSLCVRANVECRQRPAAQRRVRTASSRSENRGISSRRQFRQVRVTRAEGPLQGTAPEESEPVTTPLGAEVHNRVGYNQIQSSIEPGEAESAMGIARKICELGSQHLDEQTTSAIPGYSASKGVPPLPGPAANRHPISTIVGQAFPAIDAIYSLLDEYFDAVHWFSLVVYEPKFRRKLQTIADGCADPSQRPFLLLLAVMLGMAAWYRSQRSRPEMVDAEDNWADWSVVLLRLVESNLVDVMDHPSVPAIQTCILFGSHHVYHGRPNLSFTLLGATIKMAHAIGMHREARRGGLDDIEERKRVWWTIYTWDRFASITYGTPLGINDKDCNLSMPADIYETPSFTGPESENSGSVCYSTYQRELNRLYLIASPALEIIFGSRTSRTSQELVRDSFVTLVQETSEKLHAWRRCLPSHLILDLQRDFCASGQQGSKAYALQALSLHLTYDNILIVLYRPLISRQVDQLWTSNLSPGMEDSHSGVLPAATTSGSLHRRSPIQASTANSEFWMKAALRTSRVTELPVLAQLATDSHLVAFLAINLFNAAVVLAVMAISEPLSDTAQEVKRTMTRILRLQDLLGKRSALSRQSTQVLKKVVTMLLRRESAAMLAPFTETTTFMEYDTNNDQALPDPPPMSVEETLRLPLNATLDMRDPPVSNQGSSNFGRTSRVNESLTSVQYVMVPSQDCTLHVPVLGETHRSQLLDHTSMLPANEWPFSAPNDWQNSNGLTPPGEDGHHNNVENGLYWLWDTTWNGL
ncbi:Zn(II)2Cys6 transcription factor [Aspergillus homomorphus CBS 101889]|uniref:Putative C6 transcription factor n=1 Tax=Aspergillus homomorphus (strain CBS 101889) TaxID=1450537 RepID=A0A395HVB5_ASPHC|nr:putative C6 transcription factor [Aspergillus homomorphus CBS 101889]RAL11871.1 putative C6 transcription factor [Aspergillus homomorphus CBS 101889]